ncbi:MAG TPA: 8-oxoguanine deaminase, partial [Rhodobacteraceae bacterium]|nr:8-oxoguanine deaminase [Paracoccaceae bacterium]
MNANREILIRNSDAILTMDDDRRVLVRHDILLRDGKIVSVAPDLERKGHEVDARGCVVTPGLVNTHHHLYQTLTRA